MTIKDILLPEFDHERVSTRALLAQIPESRMDWRPHPKNFTLQELVCHLVNIPLWMDMTLDHAELDFGSGDSWTTPQFGTVQEILSAFDANATRARACLARTEDATFEQPWTLRSGSNVFFTQPKMSVVRGFILNHMVHHRAQLGMYLRLLEVPLPQVYGPTADVPEA